MKKCIIVLSLIICLLILVSCGASKEDVLHLGVNAIITEIDTTNKTITVKDSAKHGVLGSECLIDCSETPIIYCNYSTHQVKDISFDDLQVDDDIILSIRSSEIESYNDQAGVLKIEQLQLGTQRLD